MSGTIFHIWALRLAVALIVLTMPASIYAREGPAPIASLASVAPCFAESRADRAFVPSLNSLRWRCDGTLPTLAADRIVLRFELTQTVTQPAPNHFVSRRSAFTALHIAVEDADGSLRSLRHVRDDLQPATIGNSFTAPLPAVGANSRRVYVAIDSPIDASLVSRARLSREDTAARPATGRMSLLIAALCGMLVMPLIFNAAVYRVLRERFVLWHSVMAITLMLTILIDSGLMSQLIDIRLSALNTMNALLLGLSVSTAGMFAHSFIEPGRLHPSLRAALPWIAGWTLALAVWHAAWPFALREWHTDLYHIGHIPAVALYPVVLVDALRRGSRAARFQAVGWALLILVGVLRLLGQLTPLLPPTDALGLFYVGCAVEVLATMMGVADRFVALKHQRDIARTEARVLEDLTERDALTGLFNRRALETRFDRLRGEGFDSFAVLDLDRFKAINDINGHSAGDEVLRAVAQAMQPADDDDLRGFRVGGEEFVVLMRGPRTRARAEALRESIAEAVARARIIDSRVTASMGLVEAPHAELPGIGFDELYTRADRLLYEAKAGGRDRMLAERLQVFARRRTDRRAAA